MYRTIRFFELSQIRKYFVKLILIQKLQNIASKSFGLFHPFHLRGIISCIENNIAILECFQLGMFSLMNYMQNILFLPLIETGLKQHCNNYVFSARKLIFFSKGIIYSQQTAHYLTHLKRTYSRNGIFLIVKKDLLVKLYQHNCYKN